ncbi:DinB family protein [Pseudomonas sp. p1(2021b)]|uniref:DinB family protein n=1 Tax=Pseudomonas sp. p1(2021b) TaxID=2874628 RepID=UPI001CCCF577|nr:DinB family protein [Pseudomonas sp. p1(2021b)]UBM27077.1 DinB family protein [Pseudomonas sp. p1(2021b)]
MINLPTTRMLTQYKRWADQLFFKSLAQLAPDELERPRAGPMKTMIATLNHMYVVDRIWQAHLQGSEHGFTSRQAMPHPQLDALWQAQHEVNEWFVDWGTAQTQASLERSIDFAFVSGNRGTMTAGAMLLHVVNHGTYHRGWLVQMYFEIPAMPPMTDLSIYLTEAGSSPIVNC